jgi:aspartate-semialdehyde dehydrogenase
MKRVGFVGWRGMVGSVLMNRMREENDFAAIDEPVFFTTSQVGQAGPDIGQEIPLLKDATDIDALMPMEAIVTCQGGGIPTQSMKSCVPPVGRGTGSMQPPACA